MLHARKTNAYLYFFKINFTIVIDLDTDYVQSLLLHNLYRYLGFAFYWPRSKLFNSIVIHCHTILSYNIVIQYCHTILSYNIVIQYCHTILSYNIVIQYCHTILSYNIVIQYCHTIVSYNSVIQ